MGDVIPIGAHILNQIQLPLTRPVFDGFLAGNGLGNQIVLVIPHEGLHAIFAGEVRYQNHW